MLSIVIIICKCNLISNCMISELSWKSTLFVLFVHLFNDSTSCIYIFVIFTHLQLSYFYLCNHICFIVHIIVLFYSLLSLFEYRKYILLLLMQPNISFRHIFLSLVTTSQVMFIYYLFIGAVLNINCHLSFCQALLCNDVYSQYQQDAPEAYV